MKHLLGISGGKDSAALAVYMAQNYPELNIEYYTCDTGKELKETYELIDRLESVLGKKVVKYENYNSELSTESNAFDHFLSSYGHYLPSAQARWCTKKMKLEPFEFNVSDEPTISYVGIRGDENREGYISKKQNIQTIFPFRRNIWSTDVLELVFGEKYFKVFEAHFLDNTPENEFQICKQVLSENLTEAYTYQLKCERILDLNVSRFNYAVHAVLKLTDYPVGKLERYSLLDKTDILRIDDIYRILEESGVGIPAYYLPVEFEVEIDGVKKKGTYSRSRSGCFFCFYQQKIEWVWLLEQHPDLFKQAKDYEKDGFTWSEEPLSELEKPERVTFIKKDYIQRVERKNKLDSGMNWKEEILNSEGFGCSTCFI
jgi:hypothetical protein